jgi:hypothetical protein
LAKKKKPTITAQTKPEAIPMLLATHLPADRGSILDGAGRRLSRPALNWVSLSFFCRSGPAQQQQ